MPRIIRAVTHPAVIVGALTVLGSLLRLYHLGTSPLWLDEAVLYWIARSGGMREIVAQNALRNSAPPLFAILLRIVLRFGDSEAVLRSLPSLAGVASLPAVYYLMRQFLPAVPSYLVTFVVAISPHQIQYSQQLREYSLTFLLSTAMLALFLKYLYDQTWIARLFLTLIMVAGVFCQYGLVLLIVCLNIVYAVYLVSAADRKRVAIRWYASQIVVAAAAVVVYYTSLREQRHVQGAWYLLGTYWNGSINSLWNFVASNTLDIFDFAFAGPIFLLVSAVGLVAMALDRQNRRLLVMTTLPLLLALVLGLARLYPYQGVRQDMYLMPIIYLMFGAGLGCLWSSQSKWVVLFLVPVLALPAFQYYAEYLSSADNENLRPVAHALTREYREGDVIYLYYAAQPAFTYYYRNPRATHVDGAEHRGNLEAYYQEMDGLLSSGDRLWLVFSHCYSDECQAIPAYASLTRQVKRVVDATNAFLYLVR